MINVVKIGGNVIDSPTAIDKFLSDFAGMQGRKVLVHGGGKLATSLASGLGIETCMVKGRRVTSPEMLDVCLMVYAGLINKRMVAGLSSRGCATIGLSGADGMVVKAVRRPKEPVDYGEVGDVVGVNARLLANLLDAGLTPVICAITCDAEGNLLNTNADTIASEVAVALSGLEKTTLTYCFEKRGVLRDVTDPDSVISEITEVTFPELKRGGVIADGMLPKIENSLGAVGRGVNQVLIKCSEELTDMASGTHIK